VPCLSCTQVRAQEVKEEVQRLEIEQGEQDQAFEEEKAKRDAELLEELKKEARAKEAAAMEATKVSAPVEQREHRSASIHALGLITAAGCTSPKPPVRTSSCAASPRPACSL
jgi:hypothetical protein